MPTNDIKAFAAAGGANVLTQAEYLALAALSTGFTSGKASAKEVNKALRQATLVAAALAQFI
ncbi:phage tail protein, partial [Klebsiella pneumoniae]|nr:phage tail protein [Klebsiella pneumoniae]